METKKKEKESSEGESYVNHQSEAEEEDDDEEEEEAKRKCHHDLGNTFAPTKIINTSYSFSQDTKLSVVPTSLPIQAHRAAERLAARKNSFGDTSFSKLGLIVQGGICHICIFMFITH